MVVKVIGPELWFKVVGRGESSDYGTLFYSLGAHPGTESCANGNVFGFSGSAAGTTSGGS